MPKRSSPRGDWLAWGLLSTGVIVTLAVLGQEPTQNLLGPPGQFLAHNLTQALGQSVYVLIAGWYVIAVSLLLYRPRIIRKTVGWLMLLVVSTFVFDQIGPERIGGPLVGAGGVAGALLASLLQEQFAPPGPWLVVAVSSFIALALMAPGLIGSAWHLLKRKKIPVTPAPKLAKLPDEVEEVDAEEAPSPYAKGDIIPIHRPRVQAPADVAKPKAEEPRILPLVRPKGEPAKVEKPEKPKAAKEPEALPPESFDDFELPSLTLLGDPEPFPFEEHDQKLRDVAVLLEKTFRDFDLNIRVVGINTGPVITQYEVALETGMRLNKVTTLGDDLALNLKVPSVRIVAPIPGKNTVGIEIPNEHRAVVRMKEVILSAPAKTAKAKIPLFLGKDTEGRSLVYDLAEMPHLLIAGRTGTGKSVCLNTIILSMLMTRRPDEVKMIMIDPKMLELSEYGKIPHLMHPVVKDMRKAEAILAWAVEKMEQRYDLLSRARVRSIAGYNELGLAEIIRRVNPEDEERKQLQEKMPYIVIFVDEVGDLMMTMKREVEGHIIRLAQKSRAAGIHLILATQKPTVDVITGLIKSNLPARICFQVSSRMDSRVVLDEMGAEKLLGKGDMLFLQPGTSMIMRAQGSYCSDEEITRVVETIECEQQFAAELIQLKTKDEEAAAKPSKGKEREEIYDQAVEIVIREGRGSVSLLQRALGIGYGKAARFIDFMAEDGIVGPYNGSNAREVLITPEQWREQREPAEA